jgi:hypothetical protein
MSVETSAVQISINVVDANSGATIAGVEQNFKRLGAAGAVAGRQAAGGLNEMGAKTLAPMARLKLLEEELGIHIPKALQKVALQSGIVRGLIGSLGGAMMAFGAIQIGGMVFEAAIKGAEKLWDHFQGLTKASQDYHAELEKTRAGEFGNAHDIETMRLRIDEASDAVIKFNKQAEEAQKKVFGWRDALSGLDLAGTAVNMWQRQGKAKDLSAQAVGMQTPLDKMQNYGEQAQYHEQQMREVEIRAAQRDKDRTALPPDRQKQQKRDDQIEEAKEKAAEERRYGIAQDKTLGNPIASNAGASKEEEDVKLATIKADTELASQRTKNNRDAKSQAQELARIHEEALESALRGSALYHAQEAAAIEDLKRRHIATAQAINDIQAKFYNEKKARNDEEIRQTEKLGRQAQMAGMTGIAKTRAEGDDRIADLDPNLDPAERAKREAYIRQEMGARVEDQQRELAERVNELSDESATHQISAFARIDAEAEKHFDRIRREIEQAYGKAPMIGPPSSDQAAGQKLTQRAQSLVTGDAAEQKKDLTQKYEQETEQIEEQARVKFFDAEKNKTAAIQDELSERLQKYKAWRDQELDTDKISNEERASVEAQFQRRAAAAQEEAQAQMIQASSEAREKMADQFDHLFKDLEHPKAALAEAGNKALGELAARLVQHVQQRHGGAGAGADEEDRQRGMGGLLSGIFGGKKKQEAGAGVPGAAPGAHMVQEKSFAIASATIHVGSATFSGAGASTSSGAGSGWGSAGASTASSVGRASGGSTGLLTPGASGASGGFGSGSGMTPDFSETGGGSSFSTPAGASGFGGAGAAAPPPEGTGSKIMGGIQQGLGVFQQASDIYGSAKGGASGAGSSMFGGGMPGQKTPQGANSQYAETQADPLSGKLNSDGSFSSAGSGFGGSIGSNMRAGGAGGAAGAGISAIGLFQQEQGQSGGGMLGGASKGASIGMEFGGPIGAGIGAAVGVAMAIKGEKEQARVYDLKEVRPKILSDQDSYNQGGMSYSDAYQDLQGLITTSWMATKKMGVEAGHYWNDTIKPEIVQAQAKFTAEQRAGRSMYTASGAQYASGTPYVPETGYNLNHAGERIFSAVDNSQITKAVTQSADSGKMPAQPQSMGDVHLHVHAIDAQGVAQFLGQYKHNIRSAVNDSYAENSGGGL